MSNKNERGKEVVYPDVAARFTSVLASLDLNPRQFALKIESNPQNISNYVLGYALPGGGILKMIADRWPQVNVNWLLTGKGEMIIGALPADPTPATVTAQATLAPVAEGAELQEVKRDRDKWRDMALGLMEELRQRPQRQVLATGTDGPSFPEGNHNSAEGQQQPMMWLYKAEPLAA